MNEISKNTELFVNILGMSRTSAVQKWDHEAFQRAFRWANFFEQVYRKTKSKPNIIERISRKLEEACSQVDTKLGLTPLSYDDLQRSSFILRRNLLENPYLSTDFYLELVGQFNSQTNEEDNFKNQLHSLSKLKATLQILQLVQKRFETLSHKEEDSGISENGSNTLINEKAKVISKSKCQIKANAILLRKCLLNIFTQDDIKASEKIQLHVKLASMVKHVKGVDVLLYALLIDDGNKHTERVSQFIITFMKDVLIPAWKENWKYFLQLPLTHIFSRCSNRFPRFFDVYLSILHYCIVNIQDAIEKQGFQLHMDTKSSQTDEQMHKYYYILIQSHLELLMQQCTELELKVEAFIRNYTEDLPSNIPKEKNVWKKLSHDLMIASAI